MSCHFALFFVACLTLGLGGCLSSKEPRFSALKTPRFAAIPPHAGVVFTESDRGDILRSGFTIVKEKTGQEGIYESEDFDEIFFIRDPHNRDSHATRILMQARRRSDGRYYYLYGWRSREPEEGRYVTVLSKQNIERQKYLPKGYRIFIDRLTRNLESYSESNTIDNNLGLTPQAVARHRQSDGSYDISVFGDGWIFNKLLHYRGGGHTIELRIFDLSDPKEMSQYEAATREIAPTPSGAFTERVAINSMNEWLMKNCNKIGMLKMMGGEGALAALAMRFEPGRHHCAATLEGPYPYTIFFGFSTVNELRCHGGQTLDCTARLNYRCDYDFSSDGASATKHQAFVLGGLCRVLELPWRAELRFMRKYDSNWELEDLKASK